MVVHLRSIQTESYTMRPYKATTSKFPVVTIDFNNKGQKIPVSFQLSDAGSQWKVRNIECVWY